MNEVILGQWEFSPIVNCYKGEKDCSEKGNYREFNLTDHILKMVEWIIEKFIKQQVDTNEIPFHFDLETFTEIQMKDFYWFNVYFQKDFERVYKGAFDGL